MGSPKYPHVRIRLVGEDSDAFVILGRLESSLRRAGVPEHEIDAVMEDALAGDYIQLLRAVMAAVDVEDVAVEVS